MPLMSGPGTADLGTVLAMVQWQLRASAEREDRLTALLEKALDHEKPSPPVAGPPAPPSVSTPAPSTASTKTVNVERPMLVVSATMADFVAWEEDWSDYSRCQHLEAQDLATQRAALWQALDEDLRRFIREGIIAVTNRDDTQVVIDALRGYIRRQRNPLLDRMAFYGRKQQTGESFDNFYTSLNELYKASDFGPPLCQPCTSRVCGNCSAAVSQHTTDMMRDRVVCGILDDTVRHKLLAEPNLTLDKAAKICHAEEAAQQTGDGLPSSCQVNAAQHQSSYKRRQASSIIEVFIRPQATTDKRFSSSQLVIHTCQQTEQQVFRLRPDTPHQEPLPCSDVEVWQVPPERPLLTHVPEPTSTAEAYSQSGTPLSESCLQLQLVCFRFRGLAAGARGRPAHPQMAS